MALDSETLKQLYDTIAAPGREADKELEKLRLFVVESFSGKKIVDEDLLNDEEEQENVHSGA